MAAKIQFTDTRKAFSRTPTWKLRKEIFLFGIMNSPRWSKAAQKIIKWALAKKLPIEWLLKLTAFGHFCGGQSVNNCRKTIDRLFQMNVTTILDYSKEHGDEGTYDSVVNELLETISKAKINPKVSFAVFKFTGIADVKVMEMISNGKATSQQQQSFQKIKARANLLCRSAFESNVKILIDAEHSWIQTTIDNITEEMMLLYNRQNSIVYTTIQLYRHDRLSYLKDLHRRLASLGVKTGVKLVRGAYMEIERERAAQHGYLSPIQATRYDTDRDYDLALKYCIDNLNEINICAGTHNESSSELLVNIMEQKGIKENDDRIYYAQLLGMADHISNNLGEAGYNVAKYVPYGKVKEVMPYLFRRADENKSVEGEMSRELITRKIELKRRNNK